jgi:hypothetical protein
VPFKLELHGLSHLSYVQRHDCPIKLPLQES